MNARNTIRLFSSLAAVSIGLASTGCLAPVEVADEETVVEASEVPVEEAPVDDTDVETDADPAVGLEELPTMARYLEVGDVEEWEESDSEEPESEEPEPAPPIAIGAGGIEDIVLCLGLPEYGEGLCDAPRSDCIGEYVYQTANVDACIYHASPTQCADFTVIEHFDLDACENDLFFGDHYPMIDVMEDYLGYRFDEGVDRGRWACVFQIIRHRGVSELCAGLPIDFSGGEPCETHVDEYASSVERLPDELSQGRCL